MEVSALYQLMGILHLRKCTLFSGGQFAANCDAESVAEVLGWIPARAGSEGAAVQGSQKSSLEAGWFTASEDE